jgi:hypothetical protein
MMHMTPYTLFKKAMTFAKWPATVLVALNIENWAVKLGLGNVMSDNASPIFNKILDVIQSDWVQFPALLMLGGSFALWLDRVLRAKDRGAIDLQGRAKNAKVNQPPELSPSQAVDPIAPQDDTLVATVTVSDTPEMLPTRIYVGSTFVAVNKLEAEFFIEIVLLFFNATGGSVRLGAMSGLLGLRESSVSQDCIVAPGFPTLRQDKISLEIPDMKEGMMVLELRVPPASVTKIQELITTDGVYVDFRELRLDISRPFGQPIHFPFPSQVKVWSNPLFPMANQVIFVNMNAVG